MVESKEARFLELVERKDYRAIAVELVALESERGVVSMNELGDNPEEAVLRSPELELEYSMSSGAGCSVYGYYRSGSAGQPATIFVHPSNTKERDRFTLVHEYGHHVQRQHEAWANVLYSLPRSKREAIEERVADAFAAEVLIREDVVLLGSAWLSARTIANIYESVLASRSAVAMRVIEIAPASESATVVVCDSSGCVIFARANGDDVFTPARGIAQPGLAALFEDASRAQEGCVKRTIPEGLRSGSGWTQTDLVGEAAIDHTGDYAFVVIQSEQVFGKVPVWERREAECANPACELVFAVDSAIRICPKCNEPECPHCSTCSCEPIATTACNECFVAYSLAEQAGQVEHVCL